MNGSWRGLAFRLLQGDCDTEAQLWAQAFLEERWSLSEGGDVCTCVLDLQEALADSSLEVSEGQQYSARAWPKLETRAQLAEALRWLAPAALLQWDWLRATGHAAGGYRQLNGALFRAYLDAAGLNDPARSLAAQYRALLLAAGVQLPPLAQLAAETGLADSAWRIPCSVLALACFPEQRRGELFGYTLAHCRRTGAWLSWLQDQLRNHGMPLGYVERHSALLAEHRDTLQSLAAGPDAPPPSEIAAGTARYERSHQVASAALQEALAQALARRLCILLEQKRPYARGHHCKVRLQGRMLDDWLSEADWPSLRQALRASPYLQEGRLFRAMEFGGSMFGVFSTEEQALLRSWLMHEPSNACGAGKPEKAGRHLTSAGEKSQRELKPTLTIENRGKRLDSRVLYHRLLNRETYPDSLPAAAIYVEKILAWTRLLMPFQPRLRRRFSYSPEALRQRVEAIYRREMARYRPFHQPRLSRELCLWGIEQMAPAILVDGCWLENAVGAEPVGDEVRRRLLRIFADEAGAGCSEQNHPNVHRRLLDSLGLALPPHASVDFAAHPRLIDAAFPLPVYLLAVGVWPERFFPELLGLNLAIELSGLGATYLSLVDTLRLHGVDPSIVQLHLSIDNLATGHAALAREAIELHLAQLARQGADVPGQWRRVWTGYCSLGVVAMPFVFAGWRRWASSRRRTADGL